MLGTSPRVLAAKHSPPGSAVVAGLLPHLFHLAGGETNDPHPIEYRFPVGTETRSVKLSGSPRYLPVKKNVHAALVVGEHPVPALVLGAIGEQIFARMTLAVVPALDEKAPVERKRHFTGAAARSVRIGYRPRAQPEVELSSCAPGRARLGWGRSPRP